MHKGEGFFATPTWYSVLQQQSFFHAVQKVGGHIRASKKAQWVKTLVAKPEALCLVTRAHMWRDWLQQVVLWHTHMHNDHIITLRAYCITT